MVQTSGGSPAEPSPTPAGRAATPRDAGPLASIYNHYVRETIVTFEEEPVSGTWSLMISWRLRARLR